jgi:hypothetical protein
MASDDASLGGYHITSALLTCLNAAADHLHAVTSLVVVHRQLNLAATGSLARGAIENGATAFWLIHPRSRDERIVHTLQWWAKNAHDQQGAVGDLGIGGAPAEQVFVRLRYLASARRLDIKADTRGYASTEVVEYAERYGTTMDGAPPDHLLLRWQLCSGFAHGRTWANLVGLDAKVVRELSPGISQMQFTNTMERALYTEAGSVRVIPAALRVHQDRTVGASNVQRFPNDTTRRRSGVMRNVSVIITACLR